MSEIYNDGTPKGLEIHSAYSNLVGWWKMGDGDTYPILQDSSVNSNNGTMVNMSNSNIQKDAPPS